MTTPDREALLEESTVVLCLVLCDLINTNPTGVRVSTYAKLQALMSRLYDAELIYVPDLGPDVAPRLRNPAPPGAESNG